MGINQLFVYKPELVIHYDWSVNPQKRAAVRAVRQGETFVIHRPEPVELDLGRLLSSHDASHTTFIGFDVPIGLPLAYAEKICCDDFIDLLPQLGQEGTWVDFFKPATSAAEISHRRPFYPQRPGGTRRDHLVEALGLERFDQLRRQCDQATAYRPAAAALFWTMGAQQVGKAAISVWRDVLQPAFVESGERGDEIGVWPFQGKLFKEENEKENNQQSTIDRQLLTGRRTVVAEVYPGEMIHHIGMQVRSKRDQAERAKAAEPALAWVTRHGWRLTPEAEMALKDGFGSAADGEDRFDAFVGLLGMLGVLAGTIPEGGPAD